MLQIEKHLAQGVLYREIGGSRHDPYPLFRRGIIDEFRRQIGRGDIVLPADGDQRNGHQGSAVGRVYGFPDKIVLAVAQLDETVAIRPFSRLGSGSERWSFQNSRCRPLPAESVAHRGKCRILIHELLQLVFRYTGWPQALNEGRVLGQPVRKSCSRSCRKDWIELRKTLTEASLLK